MVVYCNSLSLISTVRRSSLFVVVLLSLLAPALLNARTLRVPTECPTIHAGLDSAAAGDTVLVAPGTHAVTSGTQINMPDSVVLISEQGPDVTTIEFCGTTTGVSIFRSEGARVSGFAIRQAEGCGDMPAITYGVWCGDCTDAVVENCIIENVSYAMCFEWSSTEWWKPVFRNNVARNCGIGIGVLDVNEPGRPAFENNTITDCNIGAEIRDSSPLLYGNEITYCLYYGLFYTGHCGGNCARNIIAHNLDIGVYIYADPPLAAPDFNGGLDPADANDFYDNVSYDIKYEHSGGVSGVAAKLNYWGADCPDFPSKIFGTVYYGPWMDSSHTRFLTQADCPGAAEPSTWGSIKALFR